MSGFLALVPFMMTRRRPLAEWVAPSVARPRMLRAKSTGLGQAKLTAFCLFIYVKGDVENLDLHLLNIN